jgi:Flp pilus assembly secretin CpaC
VNNREAKILVGRKIPLIVLDQAGNAVTHDHHRHHARVTPHINDDNRITLDLHPEVSDLASQATVQAASSSTLGSGHARHRGLTPRPPSSG